MPEGEGQGWKFVVVVIVVAIKAKQSPSEAESKSISDYDDGRSSSDRHGDKEEGTFFHGGQSRRGKAGKGE